LEKVRKNILGLAKLNIYISVGIVAYLKNRKNVYDASSFNKIGMTIGLRWRYHMCHIHSITATVKLLKWRFQLYH